MISRLPVAYPAIPPRHADNTGSGLAVPARSGTRARDGSFRKAARLTAAILIEAIVIVGFIVSSLGIGAEGHAGLQPGRTPEVIMAPAPASTRSRSGRTGVMIGDSRLQLSG